MIGNPIRDVNTTQALSRCDIDKESQAIPTSSSEEWNHQERDRLDTNQSNDEGPIYQQDIRIDPQWELDELPCPACPHDCSCPQGEESGDVPPTVVTSTIKYTSPQRFRFDVRIGDFVGPTNGVCPGYLQCNLVVLPAGKHAFDFLLFCQRNSKACPLLEVCEGASTSFIPQFLASGADLRTDIPKYAIYRDGILEKEVSDCTTYWPKDAVAFLIGCSFSYDGALQRAGIPLKSANAGKNVPMYKTNIVCQPAGSISGNLVVSMKPIPCRLVSKHVEITSKYPHAHGGPICVGGPSSIGIANLEYPDWGDPISVGPEEIPVFHACGVTPQAVLMHSRVPFAIAHSPGHMFVTDQPSDMGTI